MAAKVIPGPRVEDFFVAWALATGFHRVLDMNAGMSTEKLIGLIQNGCVQMSSVDIKEHPRVLFFFIDRCLNVKYALSQIELLYPYFRTLDPGNVFPTEKIVAACRSGDHTALSEILVDVRAIVFPF